MNLERMIKYFGGKGGILPNERIEYIAEHGEPMPIPVEHKVEDEYINLTIQHVPRFRRNQMRLTREEQEEVDRILERLEMKLTQKNNVCPMGW